MIFPQQGLFSKWSLLLTDILHKILDMLILYNTATVLSKFTFIYLCVCIVLQVWRLICCIEQNLFWFRLLITLLYEMFRMCTVLFNMLQRWYWWLLLWIMWMMKIKVGFTSWLNFVFVTVSFFCLQMNQGADIFCDLNMVAILQPAHISHVCKSLDDSRVTSLNM